MDWHKNTAMIERILKQSQDSTEAMTGILDSLDSRFDLLESKMKPMRDKVVRLTRIQRNAEAMVHELDNVEKNLNIGSEVQHIIHNPSLLKYCLGDGIVAKEGFEKYLASAVRVSDGLSYLASGGHTDGHQILEALQETAVRSLLTEYELRISTNAPDANSYLSPQLRSTLLDRASNVNENCTDETEPSQFVSWIVSEEAKETALRIAVCICRCGFQNKLKQCYIQNRTCLFSNVIEQLADELFPVPKEQEFTVTSAFQKALVSTTSTNQASSFVSKSNSKSKYYSSNGYNGEVHQASTATQGIISLLGVAFEILRVEQKVANAMLPSAHLDIHECFLKSVVVPIELLSKVGMDRGFRNSRGKFSCTEIVLLLIEVVKWLQDELLKLEPLISYPLGSTRRGSISGRRNSVDSIGSSWGSSQRNGITDILAVAMNPSAPSPIVSGLGAQRTKQPLTIRTNDLEQNSFNRFRNRTTKSPKSSDTLGMFASSSEGAKHAESANPEMVREILVDMSHRWIHAAQEQLQTVIEEIMKDSIRPQRNAMVHHTSSIILNYIRTLSTHRDIVGPLCAQYLEHAPSSFATVEAATSAAFAKYVESLIRVLDTVMQQKASNLKPLIGGLFWINHLDYIVHGVQLDSELRIALGQSWVENRCNELNDIKMNYVNQIVSPIAPILARGCPTIEYSLGTMLSLNSKKAIKQFFGHVNSWIESTHGALRQLSIPNPNLRTELRMAIRKKVVPFYDAIFERVKVEKFSKSNTEKYLRFPPSVLSTMISQFFEDAQTVSLSGFSFNLTRRRNSSVEA